MTVRHNLSWFYISFFNILQVHDPSISQLARAPPIYAHSAAESVVYIRQCLLLQSMDSWYMANAIIQGDYPFKGIAVWISHTPAGKHLDIGLWASDKDVPMLSASPGLEHVEWVPWMYYSETSLMRPGLSY